MKEHKAARIGLVGFAAVAHIYFFPFQTDMTATKMGETIEREVKHMESKPVLIYTVICECMCCS